MNDGFLKAAALSPSLRVADCAYNTSQILSQLKDAAARGVRLAVFPEFCLTGYTCGDLFLQRTLQQGALDGLQTLLDASRELDVVALVGLPLLVRGKLYNCAAVLCGGRLLGLVPKTYLPNYGEFYEKRQFTPGSTEVEGGRALQRSSQISTPSTKLGIWRQRKSSEVPKGTSCPQTVTVSTSVLPGVNWRFS